MLDYLGKLVTEGKLDPVRFCFVRCIVRRVMTVSLRSGRGFTPWTRWSSLLNPWQRGDTRGNSWSG